MLFSLKISDHVQLMIKITNPNQKPSESPKSKLGLERTSILLHFQNRYEETLGTWLYQRPVPLIKKVTNPNQ